MKAKRASRIYFLPLFLTIMSYPLVASNDFACTVCGKNGQGCIGVRHCNHCSNFFHVDCVTGRLSCPGCTAPWFESANGYKHRTWYTYNRHINHGDSWGACHWCAQKNPHGGQGVFATHWATCSHLHRTESAKREPCNSRYWQVADWILEAAGQPALPCCINCIETRDPKHPPLPLT